MSDETDAPALPEPVRDHLGQQLRAALQTETQKPAFLGDEESVPEPFAPQIERLETRLKTHRHGTEAVERTLDGLLDDLGVAPKAGA